jgi:cobalt-zinc-cadmium efflux system membrane fusion protein
MSMDREPLREVGRRLRRSVVWAGAALALLLAGAAVGVMWSERHVATNARATGAGARGMPGTAPTGVGGGARGDEPFEVFLTPGAVERAGIKTAEVIAEARADGVTVPGTVASNAYRDTKVNALVGGIVRRVSVELGSTVRQGQALAVIFSSDLSDAQTRYLSMRAMLEADRQKLQRAEKLVGLGAASRQELEEAKAVHASRETELAAARQRLLLLGLSSERVATLEDASQVVSEVTVVSPADGVVVTRGVNPGQVVNGGQELFVVTDLSTVWVIGDLYEQDFLAVHVGTEATVTATSALNLGLRGRVAYIDPRVDPATRTARARVEVPNRDGGLRLGMFVTVTFQRAAGRRLALVPRAAVQTIGERTVVYVPVEGEEGKFTERSVRLGATAGELVQVLDGLKPGDKVVTHGSFFLRAEAARTRAGG